MRLTTEPLPACPPPPLAGVYFFEGNVAAYRTPRRIFLTPSITRAFFEEVRGEGSPVPS